MYEPELNAVGLAIVYVAAVAPEIKTPFRYHLYKIVFPVWAAEVATVKETEVPAATNRLVGWVVMLGMVVTTKAFAA